MQKSNLFLLYFSFTMPERNSANPIIVIIKKDFGECSKNYFSHIPQTPTHQNCFFDQTNPAKGTYKLSQTKFLFSFS